MSQYPSPYQPMPPHPKKKIWPWVVGGFVALIVLVGALSSPNKNAYTAPAASGAGTAQQAVGAAQPAAASGPATTFSDGTYEVGADIAVGRYKSSGPSKSSILPLCYWGRYKNDSGEFSAIIANDNISGPGSVTVKKGEFFKVTGGCTWVKQ